MEPDQERPAQLLQMRKRFTKVGAEMLIEALPPFLHLVLAHRRKNEDRFVQISSRNNLLNLPTNCFRHAENHDDRAALLQPLEHSSLPLVIRAVFAASPEHG